jgi:O-6-methylguanine DNA methyltransferase
MPDSNLDDYRDATRRAVSPSFTSAVFARIGVDRYAVCPSALGDVYVAWSAPGVSAVRPAGDDETFEAWYGKRFGRRVVPAVEDDPISDAARAKLRGERADVPLDLRGCSEFEARVLRSAAEIRRGNARPYRWLAREIGAPNAMRAVGNALNRNPVPLLIPCHRVIRTDYSVGGYAFGSDAKRALLEREGLDFAAVERVVDRGFRYVASDGSFCLPTCGDIATRLDTPGYYGLRSIEEAHAHGLEPCSSCRPIAA